MDQTTDDLVTPLSDNPQEPLVNPEATDDEDSKHDDNNNNNDDELDPSDIPQVKVDRRASNMIQRRHSADFKNLDSKFEIKITGPSTSSVPEIDSNDEKTNDAAYFQGSDDEEDALKMLGSPKQIVKTQSLDTGLV